MMGLAGQLSNLVSDRQLGRSANPDFADVLLAGREALRKHCLLQFVGGGLGGGVLGVEPVPIRNSSASTVT